MKKIIWVPVFFVVLFFIYIGLSTGYRPGSDNANMVLMAKSILDGNILLSGWSIASESFYTTDVPFYMIGILIFGFSYKLLFIIPSLIYALVVFFSLWLSGRQEKCISYKNVLITFCFIGVPSYFAATQVLVAGLHTVTILYVLGSILCLEYFNKNKWMLIIYGLLISLACIGDPFAIWIAAIPITLLLVARIIFLKEFRRRDTLIFLATIISVIFSKVVLLVIRTSGGFAVPNEISPSFVTFEGLGANLKYFIIGVLELFNANFFGQPIDLATALILLHLAVFVIIVGVFVNGYATKNIIHVRLTSQILVVSLIINVGEFIFSTLPVGLASMRYLIPSFLFVAILIGRMGLLDKFKLNQQKALIVLCVLYLFTFNWKISYKTEPDDLRLTDFLQSQGLKSGYSPYWQASINTLKSGGEITLRQVQPQEGKIKPLKWFSDESWYKESANFMVIDKNLGDDVRSAMTKSFGEPIKVLPFDGFLIYVYDKDISKLL